MNSNLWRITIDTNPDLCNLHCIMCEDHSCFTKRKKTELRPEMPLEMLRKVMAQAHDLGVKEVIPSTMGEPLLYKYFDEILKLCKEYKFTLNLTTNGTFPVGEKGRKVDDWARLIVPVGSDVKISWNGATEQIQSRIMRGSHYQSHLENAMNFIKVRDEIFNQTGHYCNLTMQITFMEDNVAQIPELVEIALKSGFDRVKGHHLWVHDNRMNEQSLLRNVESIERWNQTVEECSEKTMTYCSRSRKFKLENFNKINNEIKGQKNGTCPFLGKELWIESTGKINICCAPDYERKSLGDFGNIMEYSLSDVLNSEKYKNLISGYRDYPVCAKCNMRR